MTAVILAGGKGTRLRSVLGDVPKPMADIAGTPFLELVLENLRHHGAHEFVLCVSHLRHAIERHFGASFRGIPLRYSVEEEPLGTGGAVKQAFELFGLKEALVVNGDTFVQADYASFWELGAQERLAVLLTHVPNADRFGRVQVHEGRITAFCEKSGNGAPGLINAGVYRVTAGLFDGMPRAFSFERDLLEAHVGELRPLMFPAGGYFIDIGVPESYAQACRELKAVVERGSAVHEVAQLRDAIALLPERGDGGALFLDRDGVINVDRHYVHKVEDCEFIDGIFELCREAKARGFRLIVVTNQAGIAKGYFTEGDFHNFMAHLAREFQRQDCPLDDVFYCPFHKEGQGIYRKDSEDRKPRPGMILKAAQKHGLALGNSVLIGDKQSDIEAGRRAGLARCIFYKAQG